MLSRPETVDKMQLLLRRIEDLNIIYDQHEHKAQLSSTFVDSASNVLLQGYADLNTYLQEQREKMLAINGMKNVVAKDVSEFARNNLVFKKLVINFDRAAEAFLFKYHDKYDVSAVKTAMVSFSTKLWQLENVRQFLNAHVTP